MKIDFDKKILFGFIVNLAIVLVLFSLYVTRTTEQGESISENRTDIIAYSLFVMSILLLIVVFLIIRNQYSSKAVINQEMEEYKSLLQSLIDNSNNPIFVKKINGEYLFINKPFEQLHEIKKENILGKTDEEFLDAQLVQQNKNSELQVLKSEKSFKYEDVIHSDSGIHTFLTVKFPLFDSSGRITSIGSIATDISERKQSEDSMREGDRFFQMSLDFLVILNDQFFVKVSPAFVKFLGYGEKKTLETPFLSLLHPDDFEPSSKELTKLFSGEPTVNYENRWLCADGVYKWISWVASYDSLTGLIYAVGHDITERKSTEESLKMADKFFNMSFDMLVVAKGDYFVKVNSAFTRILGYDAKDMADRPFLSFAHPDDIKQSSGIIQKLQKGDPIVSFKMRGRCKNGEYKWLDWTSTSDPETGTLYAVARDISEEVRLEEEQKSTIKQLFESEQKLKLILENIGEGVIVVNKEKQIVMANLMANEIFNIDNNEVLTSNISSHLDLYLPDEKTIFPSQNLPMETALRGVSSDDVDVVLWDSVAKEKKRVLISGRPIVDQDNNVIAAVMTVKDISRYKKMEEELKETELKYRRAIGFRKGEE